jgi:hypothetical protein
MPRKRSGRKRRGLLPRDESPIKLVPLKRRKFWEQIPAEVSIEKAARWRQKWTDEEVGRLVKADPAKDSYELLGAELGRSPGALRIRRSQMIHILRGERYAMEYVESTDHKRADWRQVYKVLKDRGILDLPVTEQFKLAVHLQQPNASWRGDHTQTVLKEKKAKRLRLVQELKAMKKGVQDG